MEKQLNKLFPIIKIIKEKGLEKNEILLIARNDFADYMTVMVELYWGDENLSKRLKTKEEFDLLAEYFSDAK